MPTLSRSRLVTICDDTPARVSAHSDLAMADYFTILAKAVDALDPNTARARQRTYDRARSTMSSTIESAVPPIHAADIATARIALEVAITKVEAEAVHRNSVARSSAIAPLLSEAAPSPEEHAAPLKTGTEGKTVRTVAGRGDQQRAKYVLARELKIKVE
jgi:hypothetical protein